MKCIKCGRPVGVGRYCNACGFDNKHIAKALNTADYYYNIGLEKAQMHDLSGAEMYLKKALTYNKSHKNARNLLGLVYNEMGEGGKAYIQWKVSAKLSSVEENIANLYIKQMEEIFDRTLWNDANFDDYRQATTNKSKYVRKVLKVYDKTFEAGEKGRRVGDNILRIETMYRHQSVPMLEFIDYYFLSKIGRIFYKDWSEIRFVRELSALKGIKISQLDKAREIHRIGVTRYKEHYKQMYIDGKLTKKQWETIRNFANSWPKECGKYVEEIGELEKEFKDKLLANYQIGIFTPIRNKI